MQSSGGAAGGVAFQLQRNCGEEGGKELQDFQTIVTMLGLRLPEYQVMGGFCVRPAVAFSAEGCKAK